MHAAISGTIDFREPDDDACLARLRRLVAMLPADPKPAADGVPIEPPPRPASEVAAIVRSDPSAQYDVRDLLAALVDGGRFDEYKAEYGQTLVCGFARLGGMPVGVVANQRHRFRPVGGGPFQFGGVIYVDSADKAARFVMDCNQARTAARCSCRTSTASWSAATPSGRASSAGAKLVNAISNSVVPKLTLIVGGSFGAGNYALCGKAFDPRFIFAWPGARYAVMGASRPRGRCSTSTSPPSSARARRSTTPSSRRWPKSCAARYDERPTSATPPPAAGSTRSSTRRRPATS